MINIIIHILCLLFFFSLISWQVIKKELRLFFWSAIGLKIIFSFLFGYVYIYHLGGGDTLRYFNASKLWAELFHSNIDEFFNQLLFSEKSYSDLFTDAPRAAFFAKIVGVLNIFTNGNYWLISIYFSLLSFFSSWFLFIKLIKLKNEFRLVYWFFLFSFPGTLFWSSGVLKETLTVSALFLLSGLFINFLVYRKLDNLVIILISIFSLYILIKLKYYIAAVFIPLYIAIWFYLFVKYKTFKFLRSRLSQYLVSFLLLIFSLLFIRQLSPNFRGTEIFRRVYLDHQRFLEKSDPSYVINYHNFKPEVGVFIQNAPIALFAGLFRPLVWEGKNFYHYAAGLQNLSVLILLLVSLFAALRFRPPVPFWIWVVILYCFAMATFLALSIPNFGTLERFKVFYQPFILIISGCMVMHLIKKRKLIWDRPRK